MKGIEGGGREESGEWKGRDRGQEKQRAHERQRATIERER